MLRDWYGLGPSGKVVTVGEFLRHDEIEPTALAAIHRELVMRLVRGAGSAQQGAALTEPGAPVFDSPSSGFADTPFDHSGAEAGSAFLPAAEVSEATVVHPDIVLPGETELNAAYAAAVAYLNAQHAMGWPESVPLPDALAYLPPDIESVLRAYFGLWPYARQYELAEIAAQFSIGTVSLTRMLISRSLEELHAHAQSLSQAVLPAVHSLLTLESLVKLLQQGKDVLTQKELHGALARHGLGNTQLIVTETIHQGMLRHHKPSSDYRTGLDKLTGEYQKWEARSAKKAFWSQEQIEGLYKQIDAGEYARLLLLLRDPETRDATFADMVLRSVAAANRRAQHRKRAERGKGDMTMASRNTSLRYETAVADMRGFNPEIETFEGRTRSLEAVLARALALTDPEAVELRWIMEQGDRAFGEFEMMGNIRLACPLAYRAYSGPR